MLDRFRWQHGWSVFSVAIPIASVVILISLLSFAWGFEVETSPAWQLGVHYLMLALLLAMTFVMASYQISGFGPGASRLAVGHRRIGGAGGLYLHCRGSEAGGTKVPAGAGIEVWSVGSVATWSSELVPPV